MTEGLRWDTVLVAPDKFKGSLSAADVARAVQEGLRRGRPDLTVRCVPVADGGDGTVAAAVAAGFHAVPLTVSGPTGRPVRTSYARRGDVAVVELAGASGLVCLPDGPAPTTASSRGTGEVVLAAVRAGCTHVVLGLGGSAGTDGGAGLLVGLGARVVDARGRPLPDGGAALSAVAGVDLGPLRRRLAGVRLTLACDVDNRLTGPRGAACVYAPQKGADEPQVLLLDAALQRWADVLSEATGTAAQDRAGAGAAGGVGFAALAALDASVRRGIDVVLELVGFQRAIKGVDLVITGEGALDVQTLHGKAPAGVAEAARRAGVPVVAVCGVNHLRKDQLAAAGISAAHALVDIEPDLDRCLGDPGPLLARIAERLVRDRGEDGERRGMGSCDRRHRTEPTKEGAVDA